MMTSGTNGADTELHRHGDRVYAVVARVLSLLVRLTVRLRVYGAQHIPATGGALLVANHVSHFDPVVLAVVAHRSGRQIRLLAVRELFTKPVVGSVVRALGWIPVDYGRGTDALLRAQRALLAGDLVLLYPEGTIPPTGTEVRARRGAVFTALRAGVPVVPIGTSGLERRARRRPWRRVSAIVRIGSPISDAALARVVDESGYGTASEWLLGFVRRLAQGSFSGGVDHG